MPSNSTLAIIDDDDDDRDFFCEVAGELDIHCISFKGASEALEVLEKEDVPVPEFIFLDLNMPAISGEDCLIALKKSLRLRHVKVIIYSTTKSQAIANSMFELGAFSFITKPSKLNMLRDIISNIFKGNYIPFNLAH
jgi:DNA-binding NtrC family response regulator